MDFLITVVIITSPASLILQKRLRRRDSVTSDISSLVIGNHTDCTVDMVFNMYEQLLIPEIPELYDICKYYLIILQLYTL